MPTSDPLNVILSGLARLPEARFVDDARLGDVGLGASIVIGLLETRLKQSFGAAPAGLSWKTTIGELRRQVASLGTPAARAAHGPEARQTRPRRSFLGVGLDLEDIAALPADGDPFFVDHFSAAELAAAKTHANPRQHLCGLWCVKEAAKKAFAPLVPVTASRLEVRTDRQGRPSLHVDPAAVSLPLPAFEISITHTGTTAAAVVIAFEA